MVTKKRKRSETLQNKRTKKKWRLIMLSAMVVVSVVCLAIFFITLFDYIFAPAAGKRSVQKQERLEVTLFFSDAQERFLIPEKRIVSQEEGLDEQAAEIVKALLAGPKTTGLVNTFPEKAELKAVHFQGRDTLLIDFEESLVDNHPGGSTAEMATVYSLTNTLTTNIPEIKKVKILINGKERESLKGHVGLKHPFRMNLELIAPTVPPKQG